MFVKLVSFLLLLARAFIAFSFATIFAMEKHRQKEDWKQFSFPGNDVGNCHKFGWRMLTQDGRRRICANTKWTVCHESFGNDSETNIQSLSVHVIDTVLITFRLIHRRQIIKLKRGKPKIWFRSSDRVNAFIVLSFPMSSYYLITVCFLSFSLSISFTCTTFSLHWLSFPIIYSLFVDILSSINLCIIFGLKLSVSRLIFIVHEFLNFFFVFGVIFIILNVLLSPILVILVFFFSGQPIKCRSIIGE